MNYPFLLFLGICLSNVHAGEEQLIVSTPHGVSLWETYLLKEPSTTGTPIVRLYSMRSYYVFPENPTYKAIAHAAHEQMRCPGELVLYSRDGRKEPICVTNSTAHFNKEYVSTLEYITHKARIFREENRS